MNLLSITNNATRAALFPSVAQAAPASSLKKNLPAPAPLENFASPPLYERNVLPLVFSFLPSSESTNLSFGFISLRIRRAFREFSRILPREYRHSDILLGKPCQTSSKIEENEPETQCIKASLAFPPEEEAVSTQTENTPPLPSFLLPSDALQLLSEIQIHSPQFSNASMERMLKIAAAVEDVGNQAVFSPRQGPSPAAFNTPKSRYVAITRIGSGAFKTVFLALRACEIADRQIASLAALTLYQKRASSESHSKMERELQLQEVEILKQLKGKKHVVQILEDAIETDTEIASILEYYNQGNLADFINSLNSRFPQAVLVKIAKDMARGLAVVHKDGIVHGDLKPANILLRGSFLEDLEAALADFGVACKSEEIGASTPLVGSLFWFSPEKARAALSLCKNPLLPAGELARLKKAAFSTQSDVWALGVVFYNLFCLRSFLPPFPESAVIAGLSQGFVDFQVDRHIPKFLRPLLKSMLSVDPACRPTALGVFKQLEKLL